MLTKPSHLLVIDIDGLRPDAFAHALGAGLLPNLASLMGGRSYSRGLVLPALAPAPSITFASQASLFTGEHPGRHGVTGNEFFDRFGLYSDGVPRHYAFDVGDTLAVDDAVRVFTDGLASNCLQVPTLYELLAGEGWTDSVVAGHMYARGAQAWLPPSLVSLARFTKGGNLFGLSAPEFDRQNLEKALGYLTEHPLPQVLTVYFMGVDHESHRHGPQAQEGYLAGVLDPMIGELVEGIRSASPDPGTPFPFTVICSDHGQITVPEDDIHSLHLAFPFERDLGHFFDALRLDVHDFPGEDPHSDAVVALNGGIAQVYLRNRGSLRWEDPPLFLRDVLPVAQAFWQAHLAGDYAFELRGSLAAVLVRAVEQEGWEGVYQALTPEGNLISLEEWFSSQPEELYVDPVHRLKNLAGPLSGDLLLISSYAEGYYFGAPVSGVHGGLHPEDSKALLACSWPDTPENDWAAVRDTFQEAIAARCRAEGGRQTSTADLLTGLMAVLFGG